MTRTHVPKPVTLTVNAIVTAGALTGPVRVVWLYTADRPHAILMRPITPRLAAGESTDWLFARSLLWEGLTAPVGDGDVRIAPVDDEFLDVDLSSPSGTATLTFPIEALRGFIGRVYAQVPDGTEVAVVADEAAAFLRYTTGVGGDW
jgi:hypothetical protein